MTNFHVVDSPLKCHRLTDHCSNYIYSES